MTDATSGPRPGSPSPWTQHPHTSELGTQDSIVDHNVYSKKPGDDSCHVVTHVTDDCRCVFERNSPKTIYYSSPNFAIKCLALRSFPPALPIVLSTLELV